MRYLLAQYKSGGLAIEFGVLNCPSGKKRSVSGNSRGKKADGGISTPKSGVGDMSSGHPRHITEFLTQWGGFSEFFVIHTFVRIYPSNRPTGSKSPSGDFYFS